MTEPNRQYMEDRLREIDDAQPMIVYCLLCPKWKATGSAAVTRAASEAHRAKKHPELDNNGKKVTRKKRAFSSVMTAEREAQIDEERRQRMRALGIG